MENETMENETEYIPFGDEWKKHVMKLPKKELVEMLADALKKKAEMASEVWVLEFSCGALTYFARRVDAERIIAQFGAANAPRLFNAPLWRAE